MYEFVAVVRYGPAFNALFWLWLIDISNPEHMWSCEPIVNPWIDSLHEIVPSGSLCLSGV